MKINVLGVTMFVLLCSSLFAAGPEPRDGKYQLIRATADSQNSATGLYTTEATVSHKGTKAYFSVDGIDYEVLSDSQGGWIVSIPLLPRTNQSECSLLVYHAKIYSSGVEPVSEIQGHYTWCLTQGTQLGVFRMYRIDASKVLAHSSRQLWSWLIFNVRPMIMAFDCQSALFSEVPRLLSMNGYKVSPSEAGHPGIRYEKRVASYVVTDGSNSALVDCSHETPGPNLEPVPSS